MPPSGSLIPCQRKITPRCNDHRARKKNRWIPTVRPSGFQICPRASCNMKTSDAGPGVNNGEDEQRFEHDGEVIPESHNCLAAESVGKNLRHAYCESGRATGAVVERLLADGVRERKPSGRRLTGNPQELIAAAAASGAWPTMPAGLFTAKLDAGLQHRGRDHGHDRYHRLRHHATVADHAGFRLVGGISLGVVAT